MDSRPKPAWELAVRRNAGLPRHHTANDGASVLLRVAAFFGVAAVVLLASVPWFLSHVVAFSAVDFFGLGMQQYAFYTSRVFSECWVEEGAPVVALVALTACVLGGISLLFEVILGGLPRILVLGSIHGAVLTSYRWAFWGSLFDGTDKVSSRVCTAAQSKHSHEAALTGVRISRLSLRLSCMTRRRAQQ